MELLYPNNIQYIRLGINLKYLQRLVQDRENCVANLERSLYQNYITHTRPKVKVGHMVQEVDAIVHYSQTLEYLNKAVANEQQRVRKLAGLDGSISPPTDNTTIDKFLKVTEIGGVKLAASTSSRKQSSSKRSETAVQELSTSSVSELNEYQKFSYQQSLGGDAAPLKDSGVVSSNALEYSSLKTGGGGIDEEDVIEYDTDSEASEKHQMSLTEWILKMWTSPSWSECWYAFRQGRKGEERFGDEDDEENGRENVPLMAGVQERRLFLSKAFVTFKTFTAATTAKQVIHMQMAGRMAMSEAPEPSDITWVNLYTTRRATLVRRYLAEAFVVLLIVIWVAPVTLLSYVFSYDALLGYFPWLESACNNTPLLKSLVELAQPLVLVAIMNLIPPLLTALGVLEGCISLSINQFRGFNRYFTFQIVNVFLVNTIAGSVIDAVESIYADPSSTFELLGSSLPKMGGFFTNYILVKAFTGLGLELIRFPAMFSAALKQFFTSNVTPRDRKSTPWFGALRNLDNPGWFPYAKIYAQDMLLFVICATYSCIAPLTLLAGLCYFSGASYIYTHQMIYIYEPVFETGGKWWPMMARCFVVALLFAQGTLGGMFLLKETYTEIYFLVLLFAVTLTYYWYVASIYVPLAEQLPLDMAISMDQDKDSFEGNAIHGGEDYDQPSLRQGSLKPEVEFNLSEIEGLTRTV